MRRTPHRRQGLVPALDREVLDAGEMADHGGVDQNVDAAQFDRSGGDGAAPGPLLREIGFHQAGPDAARLDGRQGRLRGIRLAEGRIGGRRLLLQDHPPLSYIECLSHRFRLCES